MPHRQLHGGESARALRHFDYVKPPPETAAEAALEDEDERVRPPNDLRRNPGIGDSKGTTIAGADADDLEDALIDAANTLEGDVENEPSLGGAADPRHRGRHNK